MFEPLGKMHRERKPYKILFINRVLDLEDKFGRLRVVFFDEVSFEIGNEAFEAIVIQWKGPSLVEEAKWKMLTWLPYYTLI
jgi:hypothetical protein